MSSLLPRPLIVVAILAATWPAAAAEMTATGGPIAAAIEREAARLTAADPLASVTASADRRISSDWSVVFGIPRGQEFVLRTIDSRPINRYLLYVDDAGLIVLNVSAPGLPRAGRNELIDSAKTAPRTLIEAQRGEPLQLSKKVRLSTEGVFVDGRKVAEIQQVLQNVPRREVAEVSVLSKHFQRHVGRGALIGLIGGAVISGALAASCGGSDCSGGGGLVAVSAVVGTGYGAMFGVIGGAISPASPDVIYRAAPGPAEKPPVP